MLACHYCPQETALSEEGARYLGWRIFRGMSLIDTSYVDVACPSCTGRQPSLSRVDPLDGQLSLDLEWVQDDERKRQ